jgi:hypothetical protein
MRPLINDQRGNETNSISKFYSDIQTKIFCRSLLEIISIENTDFDVDVEWWKKKTLVQDYIYAVLRTRDVHGGATATAVAVW